LLSWAEVRQTILERAAEEILDSIREDLGVDYDDDELMLTEFPFGKIKALRALQPAHTCRTTAGEMTRLPDRDRFIGDAATLAVEYLRQAGGPPRPAAP
jgi:hypothetical protein